MAGKTLINGTAYTISGGRTLINSTGYAINSGKTLVNGASYTISFKPQTLQDLWRNANLRYIAGTDSTTQTYTRLDFSSAPDGVYYVFSGYWVYWSIAKIVKSGANLAKTILAYANIDYGIPYINAPYVYVGGDGQSSAVFVFGGLMAAFQFNGYSTSQVDALLTGRTISGLKGANASGTAMVWMARTDLANKMIIALHSNQMAVNLMNASGYVGETLFSNCSTNRSVMWLQEPRQYISISGTNYTPTHGGAFVSIQ